MNASRILAGLIAAGLTACASDPSGLESPKHPYDFRGYEGTDARSRAMATAIAKLDANADACFKSPTTTCRNEVVGRLKGYIDDYWRQFKSDFNGHVALTNTLFDGTTSTLTAAAAITTPEGAKNILAALATSLLAIRTSAQKNLLGDQAAVVLIGQMDSDRLVIGARIDNGLDTASLNDYSFARAMSDVAEYASSMSVVSALVSMQRAGGANAQKVKDAQAERVLTETKLHTAQFAAQVSQATAQAAEADRDAAQAQVDAATLRNSLK